MEYRLAINGANFGKFVNTTAIRTDGIQFPAMLFLMCNNIEILRLRNIMLNTMEQTNILEDVYKKQAKLLGKEAKINYTEPMNIQNF